MDAKLKSELFSRKPCGKEKIVWISPWWLPGKGRIMENISLNILNLLSFSYLEQREREKEFRVL